MLKTDTETGAGSTKHMNILISIAIGVYLLSIAVAFYTVVVSWPKYVVTVGDILGSFLFTFTPGVNSIVALFFFWDFLGAIHRALRRIWDFKLWERK